MTSSRKSAWRSWRLWIGVAVSAVCLYFAMRGIVWAEFWDGLSGGRFVFLWPFAAVMLAMSLVRSARWRSLLDHEASYGDCWHSFHLSFLGTFTLPFRMGEALRIYSIRRARPGIPIGKTISRLVVERLFDLGILMGLFLVLLPFAPIPENYRVAAVSIGVALAVTATGLVAVTLGWSRWGERLTRWVDGRSSRVLSALWRVAGAFIVALRPILHPAALIRQASWALATWTLIGFTYYFGLRIFYETASLGDVLLLQLLGMLAFSVPSSPGQVGVYQFAMRLGLELLGKDDASSALAFSVVNHAFHFIYFITVGMISLFLRGGSLLGLVHEAERDEEALRKDISGP